ncbi:MAG: hypothetical protein ACFFDC_14455 [Promethearchaeota archaeon]
MKTANYTNRQIWFFSLVNGFFAGFGLYFGGGDIIYGVFGFIFFFYVTRRIAIN